MKTLTLFSIMSLLAVACQKNNRTGPSDNTIETIREMERAFSERAATAGVKQAFLDFAADSAVIVRANKVYKGKEAIRSYFDSLTYREFSLQWEADFIDVSTSGDMAYTYGTYSFSATDSLGDTSTGSGIFHTVWKKQTDGSWKFVYD